MNEITQPTVLYTVEGRVATITLNRPTALNALTDQLVREFKQALIRAKHDPTVRGVIVTGAGRGFCAGADLTQSHMSNGEIDAAQSLRDDYNNLTLTMHHHPKPIVAAVNGPAAGAGMSFAMAADVVVAAESASFLQAFAKLGVAPDCGSSWYLPRVAGEGVARALMMLAVPISAQRALTLGLVWEVVPDSELMNAAQALAERLASMPPKAHHFIKRALSGSSVNGLADQLELEGVLQEEAFATDDVKEGVKAFIQKRAGVFSGK